MKNLLTLLSIVFTINVNCQILDANKPFSQIVSEKKIYFDQMRIQYGDAYMMTEGSEYVEYLKWHEEWKNKIAPNYTMGQYNAYVSSVRTANNAVPKPKNQSNIDPWKEIGPFDKPATGLDDIGNGGGDRGVGIIHELRTNRLNGNLLLGSSYAGGLYFSSNKGLNWSNAGSDKWFTSGCTSMDFAPNNQTTWYAASNLGGDYNLSGCIIGDGGLYRTDNSGNSWSLIGDKTDFGNNANIIISQTKINPLNAQIGYLGTTDGLYVSLNINDLAPGNVIWTKVLSGTIFDVEFKNTASGEVIVSYKNASGTNLISTSSNNGSSWNNLTSLPVNILNSSQIALEVTQNNTDLLLILEKTGTLQSLMTYIFSTGVISVKLSNVSQQVGQGYGVGISNFNQNIMFVSIYDRFHKSTDGGTTFTEVTLSTSAPNTRYHADVEDIQFPYISCATCTNEVYVSTHGGVNYSNDNVVTLSTRSNGLGIARVNDFSSSSNLPQMIEVSKDHDGTDISSGSYSAGWLPAWKTIMGGDGGLTTIDYSNSNNVWAHPYAGSGKISQDGAVTFSSTTLPTANDNFHVVIQNKIYPQIIYTKGRSVIGDLSHEDMYRSLNRGILGNVTERISDFQSLSNIPPSETQLLSFIFVADKSNILYCDGTSSGPTYNRHHYRNINTSDDMGTILNSWREFDLPAQSSFVLGIDNNNANLLYVTSGGVSWDAPFHLYKIVYSASNPALASTKIPEISRTDIAYNLPPLTINYMVQEKGSNGGIYVSSALGVFYTNNDRLQNSLPNPWINVTINLPHIPAKYLEINYTANKLRVSTQGRGVWEHDLFCPTLQSATYTGSQTGSQYLEVYDGITSTASLTNTSQLNYRAGTSIQLNPGFNVNPGSGSAFATSFFEGYIHPCMYLGTSPLLKNEFVDESSNEFVSFESPFKPEISIYPNPSEGLFTLNIENDKSYAVTVYDSKGVVVFSLDSQLVNQLSLDLTSFPSGLYFAKCIGSNDFKSISFIKK
jgi:hypothetical protein